MGLVIDDLRKRRVVRVAIGYLLTFAVLLTSLGVIEAWVGLPDWAVRMVAGGAFVMMPFVLVLTWALENQGPEFPKQGRR